MARWLIYTEEAALKDLGHLFCNHIGLDWHAESRMLCCKRTENKSKRRICHILISPPALTLCPPAYKAASIPLPRIQELRLHEFTLSPISAS